MSYNWDLIRRLLHEVQASAGTDFTPRQYAEQLAMEMEANGQPLPDLDHLRAEAGEYEGHLYNGGFIVPRPDKQGATGENYILSERGRRLLQLLDTEGADKAQIRSRLDGQGEAALQPECFDPLEQELP